MIEIIDCSAVSAVPARQVPHVERALDVVLDAGTGQRHAGQHPGASAQAEQMSAGLAVDQILPGVGVIPVRGLQRGQLVRGQEILGALPDDGRLGDVSVAVKGRIILAHRCELLNLHITPP